MAAHFETPIVVVVLVFNELRLLLLVSERLSLVVHDLHAHVEVVGVGCVIVVFEILHLEEIIITSLAAALLRATFLVAVLLLMLIVVRVHGLSYVVRWLLLLMLWLLLRDHVEGLGLGFKGWELGNGAAKLIGLVVGSGEGVR